MQKIIPALFISTAMLFSSSCFALEDKSGEKMMQTKMAKISVNSASLDELVTLPGVGKKKAEAIIAYREKYGNFTSIEQLAEVKGIGSKMVDKLKDKVSL